MAVKRTETTSPKAVPLQTKPRAPAKAAAAPDAAPKGWLKTASAATAPKGSSLFTQLEGDVRGAVNQLTGDVQKLFSPRAATGPDAKPSFGSRLEVATRGLGLILGGAPKALVSDLKSVLEGDRSTDAGQTVSKLSDEQLRGMSDDQLGALGRALTARDLKSLVDPSNNSAQLLRVLTAHGTDAGHIDAVASRLGYLKSPLDSMSGAPKAKLEQLLQAGAAKPGDWKGFQGYLDTATGTQQRPGTQVTPLVNGKVAFPAMYQAIDQAKSSVNLSVFGFDSDQTGWEMAKHLAAASDRGCQVKLIYDPMGSDKTNGGATDPKIYDFMRQHGVQVVAQTPGPFASELTHRKLLVLDGTKGFIGGMNVGDDWSTKWHDVHSEVQGTGVADMQKLFVQQWTRDGGKLAPADEKALFPPLQPVGDASARIIGHDGQTDQNMKLAYLRAIDTAQKSINIACPYFSDPDVVTHLAAAAKRGVDVNVVLPQHNDKAMEQDAERALYGQLTGAGVHVYEYHGAPMAHEKVGTFDGTIATIGSSNLDARSLANNDEANVWTSDPSIAAELNQQLFAKDLTQSTPIKDYKPGLLQGLIDDAAHLLSAKF